MRRNSALPISGEREITIHAQVGGLIDIRNVELVILI